MRCGGRQNLPLILHPKRLVPSFAVVGVMVFGSSFLLGQRFRRFEAELAAASALGKTRSGSC